MMNEASSSVIYNKDSCLLEYVSADFKIEGIIEREAHA